MLTPQERLDSFRLRLFHLLLVRDAEWCIGILEES